MSKLIMPLKNNVVLFVCIGFLNLFGQLDAKERVKKQVVNRPMSKLEVLEEQITVLEAQGQLLREIKNEEGVLKNLLGEIKQEQKTIKENLIKKQNKELWAIKKGNESTERIVKELKMAAVFANSIINVEWLKNKNFSPSGSAASFSFLYILFRALNDCNPRSILEIGIGQTTKMTSQYIAYKNNEAHLILVEHNPVWFNIFKEQIAPSNNIEILMLPLKKTLYKDSETNVYDNLATSVGATKFDLLIVDGGEGRGKYTRTSVLDLIPHNLEKSFIIIFDDYNYGGVRRTIQDVRTKLDEANIKYGFSIYKGEKQQYVIFSQDLDFLERL
ncbi:MAG: hypothetical protein WCW33_00120 [Candidatus Babeliales bacterium]|jgi:hypothetical protein